MRLLLQFSGHIWGFCGAFWGAYGVWAGNNYAVAVAVACCFVAAGHFSRDRPARGERSRMDD